MSSAVCPAPGTRRLPIQPSLTRSPTSLRPFTRARASGALPFISFQVHPDRIIVECNEDGFTKNDLSAICSVGESTKSASHGYIGAKGIGFKSVFIAAWKVYIQSGHFSFYFKHEKGDVGLGMVLPVWKDADEELPGPLTRMTLHLHEKGDPTELEHLRRTIFKQLGDLQQTCLLFLRNLKRIRVAFYDQDGGLKSSKDFRVGDVDNHRVFLETASTSADSEITMEKKHYHVTKHMVTNLSKSDNRELPDTDEARRASSTAEVILAFPLTSDSEPLIEQQEVFAFLPVRESSFKASCILSPWILIAQRFLIQSDFDTSASRQDIVTTSRRNIDLLDGIAAAFIKAVLQFCEHPDLCYTWPSFLPPPDDNSNAFWSGLNQRTKRLMSNTPILKSRHRRDLRKIDDVVILASDAKDDDLDPLFDDSVLDPFLSKEYPYVSWNALRQYGLRITGYNLLLDMLQADLDSPASRMKSKSTSKDWHSAVAQVFSGLPNRKRLKRLPLLPLRGGQWVSANSGSVYLPTTGGTPIPPGVDIQVLDPAAVANDDRKTLFVQLGATEPSLADVWASILKAYGSSGLRVDMAESRAHLHYLYLTHQPKQGRYEFKNISVYSHDDHVGQPHQEDFYLPSDHPYGPKALLEPTDDAPGLRVAFVHPTYLEDVPSPPTSTHPSWKRWLHDFVGVRERLRLVSRKGDSLSDTWNYVAEHRPRKLLGLLEYLWKHEGSRVSNNDGLKAEIKNVSANMLCSFELPCRCHLDQTYLPLPHLQRQCLRFMEESEYFPLLELEGTASAEQFSTKWMFLHATFSVGMDDNTAFLLDILCWIKNTNPSASSISRHQRLLDLCVAIDAKCVGTVDRQAERKRIKAFFEKSDYIFVPAQKGHDARWANPDDCLWEAPPDMMSKYSLKHLYAPLLGGDQMELLSRFFQQTLSIPGASWSDLTAELEELRDSGCEDFDRIQSLYEYLNDMRIIAFADRLRQSLIFVVKKGQPGWYKTSECLWSSTTEIRGKVTLNDHYGDLKDFFIDTLGVKTLTLQIVYDELLQTSPQTTVDEMKSAIWSLNALLQTEPDRVGPEPLLKACVFPVEYPNGVKALRTADTEFAIVDREYLATRFKGRIKLLDYSLEDVRRLKPFFEWANLTHRYLSVSVKNITSVLDGTRRPVLVPNRDLKRKAHALLRIAATFNSPRYQADATGLYQLLRTADIVETNGISSVLRISQDGQLAEVEEAIGDMHISERLSGLTIYVPMDKKAQEFCFGSPLPTNLADWLMRDPITQIRDKVDSAAVTALTTLLTVDLSVVNLILDHQGIIQVPIANEDVEVVEDGERTIDPVDDDDTSKRSTTPDSSTSGDLTGAAETPGTPTTETYHESSSAVSEQMIARRSRMAYRPSAPTHSRSTPVVSLHPRPSAEDMQYRMLLNKVVAAARRATFPSRGAFDMGGLLDALPGEDGIAWFDGFDGFDAGNRFRSGSQLERDKKIGAAGELYAFELLSRLDPALRGWSRENWQSTIRRYVTIHPDYADMDAWSGRETADITYEDTEGDFTAMLVDRGYLDQDEWQDARPRYYIEVKTTTGPCGTPFYMSKYQYQRMRDVHDADQHAQVYMILRVFEIESGGIGMSVYLDPERLRLDGRLVFTGETWSVVPG
ncbi:hypothetical protein QBC46DRAFT_257257 [Diplogelasinospora grovesii]|uniref:Protein NO VEIN C-terminal domain-containing protein n=1 Tax=Diplogelasinospora grovesii TaxID=303347 RepID=A0AAN6S681_9PEZI|nr:hypothetical protein QBC46DRAFT_257257 [Diplogelasinospora grovesii]